jgi:hypothetical protein
MRVLGAVPLGVSSLVAAGLIAQIGCGQRRVAVTPADPRFAAESRTFADVTSLLAGTWKLKQRINPDGTPYRSKVEGVTYISMSTKRGETLGPHVVATVYAKETGVADPNFFDYPKEVVGKPFQMESTGTWLIHNVRNTASGAEVSVRTFTMAKGDLQPYKNGMVLAADIRYNLSRAAATAGAAAVPKMEVALVTPGELTDLSGNRIQPSALTGACCGMTSLVISQGTMDIGWNNKGRDIWVKSESSVPAEFR